MSIVHTERVPCACGVPIEVSVVDSVNPVRNPHHKQALLDRTLHLFQCGACGAPLLIDKPLLYMDFERQQFFCVYPRADRVHEEARIAEVEHAHQKWLGEQAPKFVQEYGRGFQSRVCFGYEELREKVVIADAGLDDLVIEACKLDLMIADPWFVEAEVATLRLDAVAGDQLHFLLEHADGRLAEHGAGASVKRAIYDEIAARSGEILQVHPELVRGPYVSLLRLAR